MVHENSIKLVLFDFDRAEDGDPIFERISFRGNLPDEHQRRKIAVTCGCDTAGSSVTIPLNVLNILMARVMAADSQRASGIIMPEPPGIIMPPGPRKDN